MEGYEIIKDIGTGSSAVCKMAIRKSDNKVVVIKKIIWSVGELSSCNSKDMTKEINILSRLKHPNIIQYYDHFISSDMCCIVMEYASNGSLQSLIRKHKQMKESIPIQFIWNSFIQILIGLKYIHSQNVVHRDLKPANILLSGIEGDIIKISDFGISKSVSNSDELLNSVVGTPCYLSPEICQNLNYNYKTDLWGIGCIMYELLTLSHPFEGDNLSTIVYSIMSGKRQPIKQTCPKILINITNKLLSIDPNDRPTINEILSYPEVKLFYNKWINGKGKSLYSVDESVSSIPDMNSIPHLCCVHNKCIILHNIGNNDNQNQKKISSKFNRSDSSKSIVSARFRKRWIKSSNSNDNKSEVLIPKPPLCNKNKPPSPKSFHVNIITKE